VMDHKEYDKQLWVDNCGCHKPPPKEVPTKNKSTSLSQKQRK
jgi:hypothetical protein